MAVLVTDGDQRSTLAVVRSLGRAGVEVYAGESTATSLAGSSRYCAGRIQYPSPLENTTGFLDFLREHLSTGRYHLLLPMTDVTVQLVAAARGSLPSTVIVPSPGQQEIAAVQDKWSVLERAETLGIACPQTRRLREGEKIEDFAPGLQYPVVIKPRVSRLHREGRWVQGSIRYALDPASLIAQYHQAHTAIPFPLIQERLEGEGRGVFLLIWNGELKAAFCHRRLREKPPWGGVSAYCESLPLDRKLVDQSFALLKEIGWQGVAMVEYKVDRRDSRPKLIEVNGRFWGSLQLAIDAGIDFPCLLYDCATGRNVLPQFGYQAGVKSRWLLGDLDHLLIRMRHARNPQGLPYTTRSRWAAVAAFLKLYERNLHYEVFRCNDRGPGWYEIKNYVRENLLRLKSRRGGD